MVRTIDNLVFEGGGILGISYLGALEYLIKSGFTQNLKRVAGTSAGAITACIMSFHLPFVEMNEIAKSLDYSKIPSKGILDSVEFIPVEVKKTIEDLFGDLGCVYRLIHHYGWFSTDYFYNWMKKVIAEQFIITKKKPPYTFADFKNEALHKDNRTFLDLYIIGTNLTSKKSNIFSFGTTPSMEVAEAIRISMSIPFFFEAVITDDSKISSNSMTNVLCDGGAINNYPLNIFDSPLYNSKLYNGTNMNTLGIRFENTPTYKNINNLLEYIESLLHLSSYIQQAIYENNPLNKERSIIIDTHDVSPLDFNVKVDDDIYQFLYNQGYTAAEEYFAPSK